MKYWGELQTKWGFGDGDAMPPDGNACREFYMREINRFARTGAGTCPSVETPAAERSGCNTG